MNQKLIYNNILQRSIGHERTLVPRSIFLCRKINHGSDNQRPNVLAKSWEFLSNRVENFFFFSCRDSCPILFPFRSSEFGQLLFKVCYIFCWPTKFEHFFFHVELLNLSANLSFVIHRQSLGALYILQYPDGWLYTFDDRRRSSLLPYRTDGFHPLLHISR